MDPVRGMGGAMSGRGFPQENNNTAKTTARTTAETTVRWTPRSALQLVAVAGGLVFVVLACEPYEPEPRLQTFVLPGPHATLDCEACHLDEPPYDPILWDTNCVSCHTATNERQELGEQDYATWGPAHYPGFAATTCSNNGGCHLDTHETWDKAAELCGGGVDHSFFPLEGLHALDCATCHSSPDCTQFSALDVVTPEGATPELSTREFCMACHEPDRPVDIVHYLEPAEPLVTNPRPLDAERRWDCKACHDPISREGLPITQDWIFYNSYHGDINYEIRTPHATFGAVGGPYASYDVAIGPDQWVYKCVDCHPAGEPVKPNPVFQCAVACHNEIYDNPSATHQSLPRATAVNQEAICIICHVNGEDLYGD